MKRQNIKYLLPITIISLFLGCEESSNNEVIQLEEEITKIIDGLDVNAPNYWDNAELVWSDEFDGNSLSETYWKFETGQHGWGNNEWQNYVAHGNIEVSEGTLKIIAKQIGTGQKVG